MSRWSSCKAVAITVALALAPACSSESGTESPADLVAGGDSEIATCGADRTPCDDGDPCTFPDYCLADQCVGDRQSAVCDLLECTSGGCDGQGGCLPPQLLPGWCLINGQCFLEEQTALDMPCRFCDPAQSTASFAALPLGTPCEDGNPCTEQDFCDNGACLPGSPPTCADGSLCTTDSCDPEVGCGHEPDHGQCNDDNPCTADLCQPGEGASEIGCVNTPDDQLICSDKDVCTTNDRCQDGQCISDPQPVNCDDGNPCTVESCHPAYGCLFVFKETIDGADPACNDGADCTQDDSCFFGKCLGEELWWSCPPCDLVFSSQAIKLNSLRVGDGGMPGEALNVDNDLKSCSPSGNCEQGLDNSLWLAGDFIDETIAENLVNVVDPLIFVAELVDPDYAGGTEFSMNFYYALLSDSNLDCDHMLEHCEYDVSGLNFDPLCNNQVTFKNCKIVDGVLTAGGSGYIFPFKASFNNGKSTATVLYNAKVEAKVTLDGQGSILSLNGVVGGAITKENLIELILAVPEEYMPIDPELIASFVANLPQDIDLDGNGSKDASSIALVFTSLPATLVPYYN